MVDATQEVEWGGVGGRLFTVVMFTIYPPVMLTVYPPYAETNSCLRSMRYVLGPRRFQCMCPSRLERLCRFSAFATLHHLQIFNWHSVVCRF